MHDLTVAAIKRRHTPNALQKKAKGPTTKLQQNNIGTPEVLVDNDTRIARIAEEISPLQELPEGKAPILSTRVAQLHLNHKQQPETRVLGDAIYFPTQRKSSQHLNNVDEGYHHGLLSISNSTINTATSCSLNPANASDTIKPITTSHEGDVEAGGTMLGEPAITDVALLFDDTSDCLPVSLGQGSMKQKSNAKVLIRTKSSAPIDEITAGPHYFCGKPNSMPTSNPRWSDGTSTTTSLASHPNPCLTRRVLCLVSTKSGDGYSKQAHDYSANIYNTSELHKIDIYTSILMPSSSAQTTVRRIISATSDDCSYP